MSMREKTGQGKLYVCQNCLNMLNYKQAKVNRSARQIRENFELSDFFETFSSCFKHLPIRTKVEAGTATYTANWKEISNSLRESVGWSCESCNINLNTAKGLLHVHHIDGVKSNNARSNLKVLCKACHRMEPLHQHLYVPKEEMKAINLLRRNSGVFNNTWESVSRFSDPAIHGALGIAKSKGWEPPEIESTPPGLTISLEAAWPQRRIAITLDQPMPSLSNWRFFDISKFVEIML
jgi:5-methylcytosine-specific restriction endonuclease McrA